MMLAILAAMPPHVIPYGSMGNDTPWALTDWTSLMDDLSRLVQIPSQAWRSMSALTSAVVPSATRSTER